MALPSILLWEDPIQTGAVFGTVLVILLSLASYSLITVVSYTCITLLLVVVGVKAWVYIFLKNPYLSQAHFMRCFQNSKTS